MTIKASTLERVYLDNIRDHQIGGITDGITPEVAHEIGFQSWNETRQLMHDVESSPPDVKVTKSPTSAEQNANERASIQRHLGRVSKQVLDPALHRYFH